MRMTYLIFDTTLGKAYTMMVLKKYYKVNQSLFKGTRDEVLEDVSPWIFQVDGQLMKNLHSEPVFFPFPLLLLESEEDIHMLSTHLKQFIYQTIGGREYFFRFWDGRVLAKFLPTCDKAQLLNFLGEINYFITDSGNEELVKLSQEGGALKKVNININQAFSQSADLG